MRTIDETHQTYVASSAAVQQKAPAHLSKLHKVGELGGLNESEALA